MMKTRRRVQCLVLVIAAATVGLLAGHYAWPRARSHAWTGVEWRDYVDGEFAAGRTRLNVLRALRENETAKAIKALEAWECTSIATLPAVVDEASDRQELKSDLVEYARAFDSYATAYGMFEDYPNESIYRMAKETVQKLLATETPKSGEPVDRESTSAR